MHVVSVSQSMDSFVIGACGTGERVCLCRGKLPIRNQQLVKICLELIDEKVVIPRSTVRGGSRGKVLSGLDWGLRHKVSVALQK